MNYPTTMSNPLLAKQPTKEQVKERQDKVCFDNMQRPFSGYQHTSIYQRPFSTKNGGETLMHKRKELQTFAGLSKEV